MLTQRQALGGEGMKCTHCHQDFEPPITRMALPGLTYMVDKGCLFKLIAADDKWKSDPELVEWLSKGWIEHQPSKGFRITTAGERAINSACERMVE